MILQYILLVVGLLLIVSALATVVWPRRRLTSAALAFVGMLLLHWSYFIAVQVQWLLFWGVAAIMVTAIDWLSPAGEIDGHRISNVYVGVSAIAGALLGMAIDPRVMVLGVVLGAFIGQMAYSRTPAGAWLKRSPAVFARYFAAKCLPAIVTTAICAISVEGFLS